MPPVSDPGVSTNQPTQPSVQVPASEQAATPVPKPETPRRLLRLLGLHGESFAERHQAIEALTPPLTDEEIGAAFAYLATTQYVAVAGGEYVLKNDLMNQLAKLPAPPTNLLHEFCGLYQDHRQDEVTRDYALQHVIGCLSQDTNCFAGDRPEAWDALLTAAGEIGGSLAGTALLGLSRIQAANPTIDSNRVDTVALQMATNVGTGDLSRITALQVCADRQLTAALPQALDLAQTGTSISMRASAIAAVGTLGGAPELKTLEALEKQNDPALQAAVAGAIKRLERRLASARTNG